MSTPKPKPPPLPYASPTGLTGKQKYNVVTDTVSGVNVRLGDNVLQAIAVVVGLVVGVAIGYATAKEPTFGMIVGGVAGLLGGLVLSGVFLMIFRGIRHAKGKHD